MHTGQEEVQKWLERTALEFKFAVALHCIALQ